MTIQSTMKAAPITGYIGGKCAKCSKPVFESLWLLDDAYNVWVGICPHCSAANLLGMTSMRGYSNAGMDLVLPTDEEIASNDWPKEWPTRGSIGPAKPGGTVAGQLYHALKSDAP